MISIYKAIKLNDVETIAYLIDLASSSSSHAQHKEAQSWLPRYLRTTNQKQYNLNRRSTLGKTPLHHAITWNRLDIARLLIDCPLVNVNKRDLENGWTPLHRALYLGRIEIVCMLTKRDDLDLNGKDWEGYKALELFATTTGHPTPLLRKLETAAEPIMGMDDQTWTDDDISPRSALSPSPNHRPYTSQSKHNPLAARTQSKTTHYGGTDLYTWGMNANYVLGHLDTENRSRPERVPLGLQHQQASTILRRPPYLIESIHMSKFHFAILTSESKHNLLLCGFGRGGRLGMGKDIGAQLAPSSVRWPERIIDVALGRDHTIAVTVSGSVITFGNNDYGQLGYDTDVKEGEYAAQLYPRKIQAPSMKKQPIIGVAASKVHSVAYTSTEIFTFGYNQGQLGYHYLGNDRRQVAPRKVVYSSSILQVVATDFSTTILFQNHDVMTLANFETQKLIFPTSRFPSNITVHSPANNHIVKLVSGGNIYTAAVSNAGDVYIWTCKPSTSSADMDLKLEQHRSKQISTVISSPRRIWIGSRADMAATSVGIGQDGQVIISTAGGQVYIGGVTRESAKDSKLKFQWIPQLQRCVFVCANPNGAFAAIRSEYQLSSPSKPTSTLASDLMMSLPWTKMVYPLEKRLRQLELKKARSLHSIKPASLDDDVDDHDAKERRLKQQHIEQQYKLDTKEAIDTAWKQMEQQVDPTLDVCFWVQGKPIYSHLCVLESRRSMDRKTALQPEHLNDDNTSRNELSGHVKFIITRRSPTLDDSRNRYDVIVEGCHLLSFFVLMDYIYNDRLALDHYAQRTPAFCKCFSPEQQPDRQEMRYDLIHLSSLLGLSHLYEYVNSSHLPPPVSTLKMNLADMRSHNHTGDVELVLKNGTMICHEVILRQRCPFFACLFNPEANWMYGRRNNQANGFPSLPQVNLDHHSVDTMTCLVDYLYADQRNQADLSIPTTTTTTEDAMNFLLDLLCTADELLVSGLKVLCERALIPMVNLRSVIMILECAHLYLAPALKEACLSFIEVNMSSFVIGGLLEHISVDLLRELESFINQAQAITLRFVTRLPKSASNDNPDDDIDLQTTLATWTKEETPITTGYIEYMETTKPVVAREPSLSNGNGDSRVGSDSTQGQPERKKKNKKNPAIKKGAPIPMIHNQQEQQPDLSSSSSTSETGWGLSSSSVETNQPKPSLRDLLEKEEAELSTTLVSAQKIITGPSKKLSQKEKRRLKQQEPLTTGTSEAKASAWGTVPPVSTSGITKTPESAPPVKSNASENKSRSTTIYGNAEKSASKGKKIFASKESILEEQRRDWRRTETLDAPTLFDARQSFGPRFDLISPIPPPTKNNTTSSSFGKDVRRGSSSFHAIQQEQKLEDDWIKNKRTKNLVQIQREETAMEGLREFYLQTLSRGSGEWIDIHSSLT